MPNKAILKFIAGFRRFHARYYADDESIYRRLSQGGQSPKTMVIACADSRVDPGMLSGASPGEMFVIRNVANLVPPFENPKDDSRGEFHGVSAAIEFAVVNLRVENIIVVGHRQCGGIRSLMLGESPDPKSFIGKWMRIALPAKEKVLTTHHAPFTAEQQEALCRACELESIVISLKNLRSFPFVKAALDEGRLELHGAYFDLESGELYEYDHSTQEFQSLRI